MLKNKKKIALFGGAFDPPHMGHVINISQLINSCSFDEIWLVPTGLHTDKELYVSVDDRKKMLEIMVSSMFYQKNHVYIKTIQLDKPNQISTTAALIEELEKKYLDTIFTFVIGADLINDIPGWYRSEKLMKKSFFLVIPRYGCEIPKNLPFYINRIPGEDLVTNNISSTLVRKLCSERQSLSGIVPSEIIRYIQDKNLYCM